MTNRESLLRQLEFNETDIVLMGMPPEGIDVIAEPFLENLPRIFDLICFF